MFRFNRQSNIKGLRGKPLVHHHIGGGGQAYGIPKSLHIGSGGVHNMEKLYGIWGTDSNYAERLQIFLEQLGDEWDENNLV
ncbi:MAG: hypothetical protein IKL51_06625 [Lachnospiraceae bacterium]|nr:hypothetical protein [Lachnospiraceae bacterium]